MRISARTLLRVCLFVSVPLVSMAQAQAQAPTIVEAESGSLGASLTTGTDATAGVNYITVLPAANNGATPTPDRVATFQVNFPAAGNYALYVRILAGPLAALTTVSLCRAGSITPSTGPAFTTRALAARLRPAPACPRLAVRARTSGSGFA